MGLFGVSGAERHTRTMRKTARRPYRHGQSANCVLSGSQEIRGRVN